MDNRVALDLSYLRRDCPPSKGSRAVPAVKPAAEREAQVIIRLLLIR
jgi:hypothetical protein